MTSNYTKKIVTLLKSPDFLGVCTLYGLLTALNMTANREAIYYWVDLLDATFFTLIPAFMHNYWTVRFYEQKRYAVYVLLLVGSVLAYATLLFLFAKAFPIFVKEDSMNHTYGECLFDQVFTHVFIIGALKIYRMWKHTAEATQAKLLLREMELKALTTQIHPHFMFNTLNALYNMSLQNDANLPESMLKLSDLMRYLLESGKKESVPLNKEVEYLENYVGLERIRLGTNADIRFKVESSGENHQIAPMILLPFVENAFKHGVEKTGRNARVDIHLDIQAHQLFIHVTNSKPPSNTPPTEPTSGTGLLNVRRRLDLLYPDQYELQIRDLPEQYDVLLALTFKPIATK